MGKREETNDLKWEMQFFELLKFKEKYGHCDVPQDAKKYNKLSNWCGWQRKWKKFRPLEYDPDRVRKLTEIAFCWDLHDKWFEKHFIEMEKYISTTGHSYVSSTENKPLWKWCSHIREDKAKGSNRLTKKRIKRLDDIGFDWSPPESIYDDLYFAKRLNQLKYFIPKFKRYPSSKDKKYFFLYNWVETQRNDRLHGILKKERVQQLNECGFVWDARDHWWEKHFNDLQLYEEKYGHCNVSNSQQDKKYKKLEFWSRRQRELFKENNTALTPGRIQKLNSIGFSWTNPFKPGELVRSKTTEETLVDELKRLYKKLGRTPTLNDLKLHSKYKKGQYELRFGNFGNAIAKAGLIDSDKEFWFNNFKELKKFLEKYNRYPSRSETQFQSLTFWILNQRQLKKRRELSGERIEMLNNINFSWNTFADSWEANFEKLKAYKQKFGHCNVPESGVDEKLGSWVGIQKRQYARKSSALTADRISKLNTIGFDWTKTRKP